MPSFDTVFFDLDGTLTDPGLGITNSVAYALRCRGIEPPPRQELYKFIGPPLRESFAKYFDIPDEETMRAVSDYRVYFADRGLFENQVYPDIPEMLAALKAHGLRLCVATSKPDVFSEKILVHFGLRDFFDFVAGASMDETRTDKHEVIEHAIALLGLSPGERERILMIGDREHDIRGAARSGLASAGVTYGYGSEAELVKAGANYLFRTPSEIAAFLLSQPAAKGFSS